MHLLQFRDEIGKIWAGVLDGRTVRPLEIEGGVYALAMLAIGLRKSITETVRSFTPGQSIHYEELAANGRLAPPLTHPDPAHCLVSGTGLTHLGSADARDKMHRALEQGAVTDSLRLFEIGLQGGKPPAGSIGAEPEWFFKGNGYDVRAPGEALVSPGFARDGGEEPELVGCYVIGPDGAPFRIGFALGNEFSDHETERLNYLYLAHSKLRACAIGPAILTGAPPEDIHGNVSIRRGNEILWSGGFLSGEANMSHTIANLEHHHFRYARHRRPGDVHLHFLGTASLSFGDGIKLIDGDVVSIEAEGFGPPLENPLRFEAAEATPAQVQVL